MQQALFSVDVGYLKSFSWESLVPHQDPQRLLQPRYVCMAVLTCRLTLYRIKAPFKIILEFLCFQCIPLFDNEVKKDLAGTPRNLFFWNPDL